MLRVANFDFGTGAAALTVLGPQNTVDAKMKPELTIEYCAA
jgi:hypothetical protein